MKNFTRRGFLIANSSLETKLVYTFFLILIACGLATIAVYQFHIIGWGLEKIQAYYRGSAEGLHFPKEFLQLLETSHFHAFMMALIYLTLAHILIATRLSSRQKFSLLTIGFLVTLLDLLLPWAIRYGSSHFATGLLITWALQWFTYAAYVVIPLYDMWRRVDNGEDA